ncbi:MAG: FRG domain-containing protein [Planctomycetota bacterium]|nr:FRG domain-containing protein [Planctomycetota bacterium]
MDDEYALAWRAPNAEDFEQATTFSAYQSIVNSFIEPRPSQRNRFLFRGVPDVKYDLRPSLARLVDGRPWVDTAMLHHIETSSTKEFKSKAHLVLDPRFMPSESSEEAVSIHWWQLMQHHGGATRLLDWTASPYVALYFAVSEQIERDCAVWMVDWGAIDDRMRRLYPKLFQRNVIPLVASCDYPDRSSLTDCVLFVPCRLPNERMVAQSGWFSCGSLPECDHASAMARAVLAENRPGEWTRKIVIPRDSKQSMCRHLWRMNITHATLYPGLEGLAGAMRRRVDLLRPCEGVTYEFENELLAASKRS